MVEVAMAPSQWERVGGAPAVRAVLDRFYTDLLAEPRLAAYFADASVESIKPHLAEVLKVVLGGPGAKTDIDLATYLTRAHAQLAVSAEDYERTGEILVGALAAFDVEEDIVATVVNALKAVAPYVISATA
ncbi:group 1 truncated hemoglobin [Actinocrinis puniceicyclus]|uniref:Group 1 truncated hemoglobin n=1 Tax=Actinocrinis puniceicyclus TaxID=977794 RepID=A0A8J8BEP6_9ACTN|nr:group 1 truncated hemoglobin [Actinocrinis puniceicyclus]MBS2966608.1 group 1 truncated hemoglobin [Actinocrinis puniceicyclus]